MNKNSTAIINLSVCVLIPVFPKTNKTSLLLCMPWLFISTATVLTLYDNMILVFYTPAQRSWRGYTGFTLSVRPSVRPSVCRRHGFRNISQVCFGISIWNFICILMLVIGRSLLIFSDVTFKMAAWRPYWIFWFPDSNFSLALNINSKLQWHNTYVYG